MTERREEFFGPGNVGATTARRRGGVYLAATLAGTITIFAFILMYIKDPLRTPSTFVPHRFLTLFLPVSLFAFVSFGTLMARKQFASAVGSADPVVWYVLDDDGLAYRQGRASDKPRRLQWSTMRSLAETVGGKLRLRFREPGLVIELGVTLDAGFKRSDGALFGDRMRAWYKEKHPTVPPPLDMALTPYPARSGPSTPPVLAESPQTTPLAQPFEPYRAARRTAAAQAALIESRNAK